MNIRNLFDRTVCDCAECVAACRYKPGMLIPEDLLPIAAGLLFKSGLRPERPDGVLGRAIVGVMTSHCEASEGALVKGPKGLFRIPTLVPRLLDSGCIFLENNLCKIHDVAPFGCSHLDMHMAEPEACERSAQALRAIAAAMIAPGLCAGNDFYSLVWTACKLTGHEARPLMERQGNLSRAIERIKIHGIHGEEEGEEKAESVENVALPNHSG